MRNRTDADPALLPIWLRRLDLVREEHRGLRPLSAKERSRQIFELMSLGIEMVEAQCRETGEELSAWMCRQDRMDQRWITEWARWREANRKRSTRGGPPGSSQVPPG